MSVTEVVQASADSTAAFKHVSSLINETNGMMRMIHNTMDEQNNQSAQISRSLHVVNDNTHEVREASHEMAAGNSAIIDEIHKLKNATDRMATNMKEISDGAGTINKAGSELEKITPEMKASIMEISAQIDQFKV